MSVNLIKLCVGIDDVEQLAELQAARLEDMRHSGLENPHLRHITRNTPRRAQEVLDGGSLYWVIRRVVQVRQRITALEQVTREDGKTACAIILDPELVRVHPRSFRPFQGWRYFPTADSPADLPSVYETGGALPAELANELRVLGLI